MAYRTRRVRHSACPLFLNVNSPCLLQNWLLAGSSDFSSQNSLKCLTSRSSISQGIRGRVMPTMRTKQ